MLCLAASFGTYIHSQFLLRSTGITFSSMFLHVWFNSEIKSQTIFCCQISAVRQVLCKSIFVSELCYVSMYFVELVSNLVRMRFCLQLSTRNSLSWLCCYRFFWSVKISNCCVHVFSPNGLPFVHRRSIQQLHKANTSVLIAFIFIYEWYFLNMNYQLCVE